jgi:glycosyltransferase involved in cell wall biosynthesis
MRVHFYTGGFTHTLHREQVHALPADVEIVGSADLFARTMKSDIANSARRSYKPMRDAKASLVHALARLGVPNIRYAPRRGADLIHSAQYPLINRTPWVLDFEDASVFAWYDPENLSRPGVRAALRRLFDGEACRAILPWSEAARTSLLNALDCASFITKIRVVYPAIRAASPPMDAPSPVLRLLFVGTAFYYKGGMETLLAYERLSQRISLELTMISFVPVDVQRRFDGLPGLTFLSRVSPADLEAAYSRSDVLIAPFHTDTFGFVVLEAFAHGLPCIVTRQFALPEIVTHGVTGLVVDNSVSRFLPNRLPRYALHGDGMSPMLDALAEPPAAYVDGLAAAIEVLASNGGLRQAMGAAAYEEVASGRFATRTRRDAMRDVYETAVGSATCGSC